MSDFNITEVIEYASFHNCSRQVYEVNGGSVTFAVACIPLTATSITEYICPTYENVAILAEDTCDTILADTVNSDPDYQCHLSCEFIPTTTTNLAARGLPGEDYVTGAASTLHLSNFAITFAAIFFVAFMFFKRSN